MISFLTESWFPVKRNGEFQTPDRWWIPPRIIQKPYKQSRQLIQKLPTYFSFIHLLDDTKTYTPFFFRCEYTVICPVIFTLLYIKEYRPYGICSGLSIILTYEAVLSG